MIEPENSCSVSMRAMRSSWNTDIFIGSFSFQQKCDKVDVSDSVFSFVHTRSITLTFLAISLMSMMMLLTRRFGVGSALQRADAIGWLRRMFSATLDPVSRSPSNSDRQERHCASLPPPDDTEQTTFTADSRSRVATRPRRQDAEFPPAAPAWCEQGQPSSSAPNKQ